MPRTLSAPTSDVQKDHREADRLSKEQNLKDQKPNDNKDQKETQKPKDDNKDQKETQKPTDNKDQKETQKPKDDNEKIAVDLTDPHPRHDRPGRLQLAPEGAKHDQEPANTKTTDEQLSAVYTDSEREKLTDRYPKGPQKDTAEKDPSAQKGNADRGPAQQDDQAGKHDLLQPEKAPQGMDETKPLRNKLPEPIYNEAEAGGVKNSERHDHQKQRSPAEERKYHHEQALAHHPSLFQELERRKKGMTPLHGLDELENPVFEKNVLHHADEHFTTGGLKEARERLHREEKEWRDSNRRGLSNLHDVQHWQRREFKDWERTQDQQENEHKGGVLDSIGHFASDKWNALTHGSEHSSDKSQHRAAFGDRSNVRQDFPVQKPGTSVRKGASPLRQEQEPAKRSWWPLSWGRSDLQHMPSWRDNTRLIDTMTDDELSMMAL